jgi:radical SAM enzyme (TIGR01210 family)
MCDLWKYTTIADTPKGAIPAQISAARHALGDEGLTISGMKLYNAGSFFDRRAVPESDDEASAEALSGLSRVIVESHPSLVGPRVDRFRAALERRGIALEVAMGLETAHPVALDALNKRFTLQDFTVAAKYLQDRQIGLRVFLLISPPFVPRKEQHTWLLRSLDAAFDCGASAVSLVPTRSGNGTLEALPPQDFAAPDLDDIERSLAVAIASAHGRGRVFVDLWDIDRFAGCTSCRTDRAARMHSINLAQEILPSRGCTTCGRADS